MIENKTFLNNLKICLRKEKNAIASVIVKVAVRETVLAKTVIAEVNSNLL